MPLSAAAPTLGDKRVLAAAGLGVGVLAAIALLASIGGPQGPIQGLSWVVLLLARAGAAPVAYILAAAGLGRLARPLLRGSRDEWALQLAVGLALMLSLSHALGVMRFLSGPQGHIIAIGVVVVGLGLLVHQLFSGGSVQNAAMVLPLTAIPGFFGVALMVVAACNPPGWLWESEFGGYDALAYHLELPQQWLERGWLWPLAHNVYSYLPSYVEGAYMHLGAILGGPTTPTPASPMVGLLSGDGAGVLACQLLHAGLTVCAGVLAGRATRLAAERCGLSARAASAGAGLAASLYLLTPWNIVVGSLAYNEAGMTALGAGALAAAMDDRLPAVRRGLVVGLLVGAACCVKPTALTLIGVPVGIALLGLAPAREWSRLVAAGSVAGVAVLAPWLVRNWYACGNPVFPFASSVFGASHWDPEQYTRYAIGHSFDGSFLERISLMLFPDSPNPVDPTHANVRGLFHAQWFLFFPLCVLAGAAAVWVRASRRIAMVLVLGMAGQLTLWLFTTHIQSRFLIPMAVTGSVVFGLASAALWRDAARREVRSGGAAALAAILAVVAQGVAAVFNFAEQNGSRPNARLIDNSLGGLNGFSAHAVREARLELSGYSPSDRRVAEEALSPTQYIDFLVPSGAALYLLGDSAALYFRPPLIYHSTWDASPLGLVMRSSPGDPAAWTARLRREGIGLVLVNFSELERLRKAGWYDPLVTPEAVAAWLEGQGTLIRSWPETGQALFSIAPGGSTGGGAGR